MMENYDQTALINPNTNWHCIPGYPCTVKPVYSGHAI